MDSSRAAAREYNINRKKFNKVDGFNLNQYESNDMFERALSEVDLEQHRRETEVKRAEKAKKD